MQPDEMADAARIAIAAGTRMSLKLPPGATRKFHGFPRGELLCECHDKRKVYSFDPARVLAWLQKNDLLGKERAR